LQKFVSEFQKRREAVTDEIMRSYMVQKKLEFKGNPNPSQPAAEPKPAAEANGSATGGKEGAGGKDGRGTKSERKMAKLAEKKAEKEAEKAALADRTKEA
jgi:tryptophanyl-tRNA synthetase